MSGEYAMSKPLLSQQDLKSYLEYHPASGEFYWKISIGKARKGSLAGFVNKSGYTVIRVKGIDYLAHRLAHLYMSGENTLLDIDHIDMNKSNNKWNNLREANDSQNHWNVGLNKNNTSGYKGVSFNKRAKKYKATIVLNSNRNYLGHYDTAEQAHEAYKAVAIKHHGTFYRDCAK